MKLRSLLYVPADNDRFVAKSHDRGADAIILDLEDAVPTDRKDVARANLGASVARAGQSGALVFVRINSDFETACLDAEAARRAGAYGLLVAKADPHKLAKLDAFLSVTEAGAAPLPFIALVEDAGAVLEARDIARCNRVIGLIAGGEDIATHLGAQASDEVLRLPKLLVHYAAKAEGLKSLGLLGSIADYQDAAAIQKSAASAYSHGFDGATCIHPNAIDAIHLGFCPTPDEIDWAERVTAAAMEASGGAFVMDGKMVDAPIIKRAVRILHLAAVSAEPARSAP